MYDIKICDLDLLFYEKCLFERLACVLIM